jgi:DNA modification methylase
VEGGVNYRVLCGDALSVLRGLPAETAQCCITSPPYYAQRDYGGFDGELGRETTPSEFVARLVEIFEEVRRVLAPDGVAWINLGDSYCSAKGQAHGVDPKQPARRHGLRPADRAIPGLKPKDLIGVPWMVAFALRDAGWYLRRDQIWHKPNAMPGSQLDRPTSAHEYVFLLSKARRYFFDVDPIRERMSLAMTEQLRKAYTGRARKNYAAAGVQNPSDVKRRILASRDKQRGHSRRHAGFNARWDAMTKAEQMAMGSLPRSVWSIATNGAEGRDLEHFALMPKELARKLVLSACPIGGVVLDPFCWHGDYWCRRD